MPVKEKGVKIGASPQYLAWVGTNVSIGPSRRRLEVKLYYVGQPGFVRI